MHLRRSCGSLGLVLALLGFLAVSRTGAATTYNYFYVASQNSFTSAPDSDVLIKLFLQEVNSDQSTNSLLGSEHGLFSAGVNIDRSSGLATITTASANTGSVPNGFDDPTSGGLVNSPTSATISESTDPPPFGTDTVGVEAGPLSNGVSEVYLGSVTIHTDLAGGQTSTFTVSTSDSANGATFTFDSLYDLDNNADPLNPPGAETLYNSAASTSFTITTTSAPEPDELGLVLGSVVAMVRRHRRMPG